MVELTGEPRDVYLVHPLMMHGTKIAARLGRTHHSKVAKLYCQNPYYARKRRSGDISEATMKGISSSSASGGISGVDAKSL